MLRSPFIAAILSDAMATASARAPAPAASPEPSVDRAPANAANDDEANDVIGGSRGVEPDGTKAPSMASTSIQQLTSKVTQVSARVRLLRGCRPQAASRAQRLWQWAERDKRRSERLEGIRVMHSLM
jgi:hypothetical protein